MIGLASSPEICLPLPQGVLALKMCSSPSHTGPTEPSVPRLYKHCAQPLQAPPFTLSGFEVSCNHLPAGHKGHRHCPRPFNPLDTALPTTPGTSRCAIIVCQSAELKKSQHGKDLKARLHNVKKIYSNFYVHLTLPRLPRPPSNLSAATQFHLYPSIPQGPTTDRSHG